jgi:hypothetical protein
MKQHKILTHPHNHSLSEIMKLKIQNCLIVNYGKLQEERRPHQHIFLRLQ